jgi:hypothetical protein
MDKTRVYRLKRVTLALRTLRGQRLAHQPDALARVLLAIPSLARRAGIAHAPLECESL